LFVDYFIANHVFLVACAIMTMCTKHP